MIRPSCCVCGNPNPKLRRRINGNGSQAVYWFCEKCQHGAEVNERAISHKEANAYLATYGKKVTDLPITANYTQESEPCIICGAKDTEYNHWMPQMFADDPEVQPEWDKWANVGAALCRKHHAMWHHIVTPYMPGIGAGRTSEP